MVSEMTTYVWNFGSDATGLKFSVSFDGSQFTVTVETGYLNVNALWFSDGNSSSDGFTLPKTDSSLNMNGSNTVWAYDEDGNPVTTSEKTVWDEYLKISSTGLTSTPPDSYIVAGTTHDSFTFSLPTGFDFVIDENTVLGIRATSTSGTTGGSIKWADGDSTVLNQPPVAVADTNAGDPVVEAGVNPGNTVFAGDASASGNVLANDTDVDTGDTKEVSEVNGVAGNVGTAVAGTYGSITINADGSYTYTLDNGDTDTNALAQDAPVTDEFTYTVEDANGATSTTTLTISITGTNDAPVAMADTNAGDPVVEAGNPFAGDATASGNVLANDTDFDTGDTKTVSAVNGSASNVGNAVLGTYGSITINGNGSYTYTLDNADPDTNGLAQGASVTDQFAYTVQDASGATSITTLTISITGTNDAAIDMNISVTTAPGGNGLPSGNFAQLSAVDSDGGGAHLFSLQSLTATTLSGGAATNFLNDVLVSSTGVVSDNGLDQDRIYSMQVQVAQDGATFSETFTIITGTNAGETLNGSGDDLIFGRGDNDTIFAGSGNDTVMGQNGNDRIHGGSGNDVLTGGTGGSDNNDTFVFDTALNASTNVDAITDFAANNVDKIELDQSVFAALSVSASLAGQNFSANAGGNAADADDFILYDTSTGNLYYDADGNGDGAAKILFATLTATGTVDATDFRVVA